MYPLGSWFVSGICVWIACKKETVMMMMIMIMMMMIIIIIIIIIIHNWDSILISEKPINV